MMLRIVDPLVTLAAGVLAYRLYPPLGSWELPEHYVVALVFMGVMTSVLFALLGLYGSRRGVTAFEEVRQIFRAVLVLAALWFAFVFFSQTGIQFSRVWSAYWIAITLTGHLAFRGGLRFLLRHMRRRGLNLRHVVIVGAGKLGTMVAERLHAAPWAGFAIHGFYDDDPVLADARPAGLPVLGTIDRLLAEIDDEAIDQVWITLPLRAELRIRGLIDRLQQTSVQVRFVPDIYSFNLLHHSVSEIEGLPVINVTDSPPASSSLPPAPCCTARCGSPGMARGSTCSSSARCWWTRKPIRVRCGPRHAKYGQPALAPSCAAIRWTNCRSSSTC
jgi:putative colanic acid biosynthesis UDP-glucose lipid carrier transferase